MRHLKLAVKFLVVAAILFFILHTLVRGLAELRQYDLHFNGFLLLFSLPVFLLSYAVPTGVWLWLLKCQRCGPIPFVEAYRIWFYSFMGRYVPGKVTLVAVRAEMAYERGIPRLVTTSVAFVEVVFSTFSAILLSLPIQFSSYRQFLLPTFIFLGGAMLGLLLMQRERFVSFVKQHVPGLKRLQPLYLPPRLVLGGLLLYTAYWILAGVALGFFLASFLQIDLRSLFLIIPSFALACVGGMLALLMPSGIGVRELIFATLLQLVFAKELAYAVSVAARVWNTILDLVVFAIIVTWTRLKGHDAARISEGGE
jgi:glycosyltransferase 2 family protein